MRVLVAGLGRMGMRHLRGALDAGCAVTAVSADERTRATALELAQSMVPGEGHRALASLEAGIGDIDAAILAGTADRRPEMLERLLGEAGPRFLLLEKPLCQSAVALDGLLALAKGHRIHVNLAMRANPLFRAGGPWDPECRSGPVSIQVTGGALGLGCNGIHWIDLACRMARSPGRLLFGEISPLPIASGRGSQFGDFGGLAVFGFDNGTRLTMSLDPASAAPPVAILTAGHALAVLDGEADRIVTHERAAASIKPPYLYGQDYARTETGWPEHDIIANTRRWVEAARDGRPQDLPTLAEAEQAHRLLFQLLDLRGAGVHPIT